MVFLQREPLQIQSLSQGINARKKGFFQSEPLEIQSSSQASHARKKGFFQSEPLQFPKVLTGYKCKKEGTLSKWAFAIPKLVTGYECKKESFFQCEPLQIQSFSQDINARKDFSEWHLQIQSLSKATHAINAKIDRILSIWAFANLKLITSYKCKQEGFLSKWAFANPKVLTGNNETKRGNSFKVSLCKSRASRTL